MRDRIELWRDVKVNEAGSWYVLPSLLQSSLVDDPILTIPTRQVGERFPSTPSFSTPARYTAPYRLVYPNLTYHGLSREIATRLSQWCVQLTCS